MICKKLYFNCEIANFNEIDLDAGHFCTKKHQYFDAIRPEQVQEKFKEALACTEQALKFNRR